MKIIHFFPILAAFVLASCGNTANEKTSKSATQAEAVPMAKPTPDEKEYQLVPFAKSAEFADAKLESMAYKNGKFTFKYSGKDYQLGDQTSDAPLKMCANSAKGQHIHLIVDDEPYSAHYTPEFDYTIADGEHTILAFLSRSYHESIKNGQAFIAKKVTVKNGSITKSEDIKEPMIFYSRPKGDYVGKAETDKVMLDFFLINAELGEGKYSVAVDVNHQRTHFLKVWEPYYIENLPMGENVIKLTLLNPNEDPVKTPYNPIERTFNLKEDPAQPQATK
ncbi:MAG: hypothetical protein R2825_09115 [Saprospiraceae bacterium]